MKNAIHTRPAVNSVCFESLEHRDLFAMNVDIAWSNLRVGQTTAAPNGLLADVKVDVRSIVVPSTTWTAPQKLTCYFSRDSKLSSDDLKSPANISDGGGVWFTGVNQTKTVSFKNMVKVPSSASGKYYLILKAEDDYSKSATARDYNSANDVVAAKSTINVVKPAFAVQGQIVDDLNNSKSRQTGEIGIPNATVWIDKNSNGKLDSGESSTKTDSAGKYKFSGLAAGTYRIAAKPAQSSYTSSQTYKSVTVSSSSPSQTADFFYHWKDSDDTFKEAKAIPFDYKSYNGPYYDNVYSAQGKIESFSDVCIFKYLIGADYGWEDADVDVQASNGLDLTVRVFEADGSEIALRKSGVNSWAFVSVPGGAEARYVYIAVSSNGNNAYNPITGLSDSNGKTTGNFSVTVSELGGENPYYN